MMVECNHVSFLGYSLSVRYPKTGLISNVQIDGFEVKFLLKDEDVEDTETSDNPLPRTGRSHWFHFEDEIFAEYDSLTSNHGEDLVQKATNENDLSVQNHHLRHPDIDEEEEGKFNVFMLPVSLPPRKNVSM